MSDNIDIYVVVTKLVGPIRPVGETDEDDRRYTNLTVMCGLVNDLLSDINKVVAFRDRAEFSMKRAGKCAGEFFESIGLPD